MRGVVERTWTFLTNHARLLLLLAAEPDLRLRDLAERAAITERSAQAIVRDLTEAGYLTKTRTGRRNSYAVEPHAPFRHPVEADHEIGELLSLFAPPAPTTAATTPRPRAARRAGPRPGREPVSAGR